MLTEDFEATTICGAGGVEASMLGFELRDVRHCCRSEASATCFAGINSVHGACGAAGAMTATCSSGCAIAGVGAGGGGGGGGGGGTARTGASASAGTNDCRCTATSPGGGGTSISMLVEAPCRGREEGLALEEVGHFISEAVDVSCTRLRIIEPEVR